jgi:hypothetical protein
LDWTTVTVTIPTHLNDRIGELTKATGVSLDGFVAASMEIRCREHEERTTLADNLAERSRAFDDERAQASS